jgi:ABC-type amino acid transport substrate-binding protein
MTRKEELYGDEYMNETLTFERGKIDHILSDLASLMLYFKDLRDKNLIDEDILERIVTIYEHLHTAVVNSRLDNDKLGKQ